MSSKNRYKLENNSDLETINSFKILISNIKALKDKTWGCPWQKIQSHVSLIPFLYEESNEFIDAIYEKNADNIVTKVFCKKENLLALLNYWDSSKVVDLIFRVDMYNLHLRKR